MRIAFAIALGLAILAGCTGPALEADSQAPAPDSDLPVLQATKDTGIIRGVVVDEAIRPIGNATVSLERANQVAITTEAGAFGFQDLSPGLHCLKVEHAGYATSQSCVEVEAGVQDPAVAKVQLTADASTTPWIAAYKIEYLMEACVSLCLDTHRNSTVPVYLKPQELGFAITPNATVAQSESIWKPTMDTARDMQIGGYSVNGFQQPDGYYVDDLTYVTGPSPIAFRVNATSDAGSADYLGLRYQLPGTDPLPVGITTNQVITTFFHVFYQFSPDPDWLFSRDGDHPVPP